MSQARPCGRSARARSGSAAWMAGWSARTQQSRAAPLCSEPPPRQVEQKEAPRSAGLGEIHPHLGVRDEHPQQTLGASRRVSRLRVPAEPLIPPESNRRQWIAAEAEVQAWRTRHSRPFWGHQRRRWEQRPSQVMQAPWSLVAQARWYSAAPSRARMAEGAPWAPPRVRASRAISSR